MKKLWSWPVLVTLLLCGGIALATDAFFAGRAVRITQTAAATCSNANYNCKWFDTSNRERFWNGTTSLYTTNSTESTPTKGKILYGNGTNWVSLSAPNGRQVLAVDKTDGGLKWVSPTDGGLVLP